MTIFWLYLWLYQGANLSEPPIRFTAENWMQAARWVKRDPRSSTCFHWELYDRSGWNEHARRIMSATRHSSLHPFVGGGEIECERIVTRTTQLTYSATGTTEEPQL